MDAKSLKIAPTATIHVKNAAGEPLYDDGKKVQIVLHGPGSQPFSTVEARQTARMLKRMNDNDGKMTAATAEERRQEAAEDLADVTIGFENLTYDDLTGTALFRAVYGDPELGYIAAQITKAIKDWGQFFAKVERELKVVVRQMAWLNATPKPDARTKRAQIDADVPKVTRLARFKADKIKPQMPPNPMPHVVDRLVEIGLNEQAGMGVAPLTWATIEAWTRLTGIDLMPWEARLIRRLSIEYLSEGNRAESENCPPPWRGTWTSRDLEVEQSRLEDLLG